MHSSKVDELLLSAFLHFLRRIILVQATTRHLQRGGWCVVAVVLCAAAPPPRDTSEAHNVRYMFSMISPCTISTAKRETVLRGCAYL